MIFLVSRNALSGDFLNVQTYMNTCGVIVLLERSDMCAVDEIFV